MPNSCSKQTSKRSAITGSDNTRPQSTCAAEGVKCNKVPRMTIMQSVPTIVDVSASAVAAAA